VAGICKDFTGLLQRTFTLNHGTRDSAACVNLIGQCSQLSQIQKG